MGELTQNLVIHMKGRKMCADIILSICFNLNEVLYDFFLRWKGASDIGFVDIQSGNELKLKEAVATQGPCAIAIDAGVLP